MLKSKSASYWQHPRRPLKGFDLAVHQYGTFINGYSWDFFGCLTFRYSVCREGAHKLLWNHMDRLEEDAKTRLAWLAAWEEQHSGCGMPGIPLHCHFVMAGPLHKRAEILTRSRRLWYTRCGDNKVDYFDPARSGAFYIAKTAGCPDFELELNEKSLKRLPYHGPRDIYADVQKNSFVPNHAKDLIRVKTLRIAGTPPRPS